VKPLQVYVSEAELERLDAWSRRHGMNKSQAVRAALRTITREPGEDPLLAVSGSIQGLTEHWFDPCELLAPDARSELRPEYRRRQDGGGWEFSEGGGACKRG
jgi:Ribbon-helix-helix protein, copG family